MKKLSLTIGIIVSFIGCVQGSRYFFDYSLLTQYGKGFVWGSVLLFLLGVVFIYFGLRKGNEDRLVSGQPMVPLPKDSVQQATNDDRIPTDHNFR